MMKALTVSAVLCLIFSYTAAAEVMAVQETPKQAKTAPVLEAAEDMQGFEAVASSEIAEEETAAAARRFCPSGWFNHGDRCYLYVGTHETWMNAEKHCVNQGAALASLRSPDEYNFLQNLIQVAQKQVAWLGGFYFQGEWMWIDRTGFYYTNWELPASDTYNACIFMRAKGGWSNTNCGSSEGLPFFCALNLNSC